MEFSHSLIKIYFVEFLENLIKLHDAVVGARRARPSPDSVCVCIFGGRVKKNRYSAVSCRPVRLILKYIVCV